MEGGGSRWLVGRAGGPGGRQGGRQDDNDFCARAKELVANSILEVSERAEKLPDSLRLLACLLACMELI